MDMTDLWRATRRFWLLCLVTFAATTALGFVLATSGEPSYEATSTVVVSPSPAEDRAVQFVDFEITKIVAVVTSRDFIVGLYDDASEAAASASVVLEAEPVGGIVRLTASGDDRAAVAEFANAAAVEVVERYTTDARDRNTPPTPVDLVDVVLVESATPPEGPGLPSILPVMIASLVLGVILAGAVAAVAYKSSLAFDLGARIRTEVGIPVLGEIPVSRELRAADVDMRTLVESHPPVLVEAFQSLRINTQIHLDKGARVLAVTSWESNEGKSTVTAALGIMLASVGHDVVLIDADLRAPRLHVRLNEPFGEGLAKFGELGLDTVLQKTQYPRLLFIPAGVPDRHPAQVIAVELPQAVEAVRDQLPDAVILIDSPALGPVGDGGRGASRIVAESAIVTHDADKVLIVVAATTSKLPEIAASVRRLGEDGVSVIGAVINRQRKQRWWQL